MNHKTDQPSRRSFLKTSLGTVSAAALTSNLSSRVYAANSDVIKIGLIGCGGRGSGAALDAMRADDGVQLVAMADVFQDHVLSQRQRIKEAMPDRIAVDDNHCFVGLDGYKHVIESDVDVVLIACASQYHPKYMKAALDAGKHVFVEKPHGIDPAGVRLVKESCALAKKKKLCVMSGLMNRHVPGVQETIKRIHDGAIGEIVAIEENYLRAPYVLKERQPGDSEMEYQYRNWYHFSWLSGDDVIQSLVHNLDKSLWLLHGKTPATAHGLAGRSASFGEIYGDVFDHHTVVYEFDDGTKIYALCRTQYDCHHELSDIILGTKGQCDLLNYRITGETNWSYEGPHESGFINEHRVLFSAIRKGENLVTDYMVNGTMIAVLGQMACYSGKKLTWDEAYNSDFTFGPKDIGFDSEPPKRPGPDGNYPIAIPGKTKVI